MSLLKAAHVQIWCLAAVALAAMAAPNPAQALIRSAHNLDQCMDAWDGAKEAHFVHTHRCLNHGNQKLWAKWIEEDGKRTPYAQIHVGNSGLCLGRWGYGGDNQGSIVLTKEKCVAWRWVNVGGNRYRIQDGEGSQASCLTYSGVDARVLAYGCEDTKPLEPFNLDRHNRQFWWLEQ